MLMPLLLVRRGGVTLRSSDLGEKLENVDGGHVVIVVLFYDVGKVCDWLPALGWKFVQAWHQPNLPIDNDLAHTCLLLRRDVR